MNPPAASDSSAPATRRQFLKQASAATALTAAAAMLKTPVYGQNQAPSTGRVLGANDRLVVAVIGLERGKAHISREAGRGHVETRESSTRGGGQFTILDMTPCTSRLVFRDAAAQRWAGFPSTCLLQPASAP